MRIVFLAPEAIPVPPLRGGSVEICIHQITRHLPETSEAVIVSRRVKAYPNRETAGRIRYIRVASGSPSAYLRRAILAIAEEPFDCLQVDNRPIFLPEVKRRFPERPIGLFMHSDTFIRPPYNTLSQASRQMRHADLIIANSESLQRRLAALFPEHQAKIRYVHLGVDNRRFRPPLAGERRNARRKLGISGGRFTVIFAGRIVSRKGIPTLIRAMRLVRRKLPRAQLVIAGRPANARYPAQLKEMARKAGVPIRWAGYLPHRRMHELYWAGDLFACPSQKHEAFGLVVAEAMASGIPVAASRIGGIPELVRHGDTGLLVNRYASPEAWAEAMMSAARNSGRTEEMARKARVAVSERFSWRRTSAQLLDLYRPLTEKGG